MKRVFASSLLLLYITAAVGVSLNLHYCGGKLAKVSLASHAKDCEGKTAAKADAKCCKNKQVDYKVKADQKAAPFFSAEKAKVIDLFHTAFAGSHAQHFLSVLLCEIPERAPPPQGRVPLFLQHCTFRI